VPSIGAATSEIEGTTECVGETGKEYEVKVHYDEGVANRIGPKP